MSFALTPRTDRGAVVVAAAESLVETLAERAQAADAANEVCRENFDDLISSGIASAFVPEELGGLGLTSVHDWVLTIITLARGDASAAIAINMQLGVSRGMALAYAESSESAGVDDLTTKALAESLRNLVTGEMLICATATEPGTDNLHPLTEAVRDGEGWRINGRKIFVTLSPIATYLGMNLRVRDDEGDHLATVMLPMDTPGLIPQDDWDALGMRSSGSQSVVFEDARVPAASVRMLGEWGKWSVGMLHARTLANIPLVGAFLGIAEAAHDIALAELATRSRVGRPAVESSGVQHVVAEMALELAQCRAVLDVAAAGMDAYFARHVGAEPSIEEAHGLMNDYQAAKWAVNRGAIDVVSKAMDLLGGSGYTNAHVLARLYRDVRAGPFMQPFGVTELREYVGQVTLGQFPEN
ncbi:MAG: acyl-CoA/acyl-ACP dehydrogenase [Actinomycetota bacterium]|nr:acyl-CoA/acyl-ACP dehydrogenase [Actinomycetota bacterium]